MKKKRALIAVLAAVMMVIVAMPVLACTPKLNPPSVKIPDIEVKFDDKTQQGIQEAAKKFVEKNTLEKPTVQNATYIYRENGYGTYGCLCVRWNAVESTTSYEVEITKADGSKTAYQTPRNTLAKSNYTDSFLSNGMDGAKVRIKAYGENETFSLWSDYAEIKRWR